MAGLIILLSVFSSAQSDIFREVYNRQINVSPGNDPLVRMLSAQDGSDVYFTESGPFSETKTLYIYKYNLLSYEKDSIGLTRTKETESFFSSELFAFEIKNKTLLALSHEFIYHFVIDQKKIKLLSKRPNPVRYRWLHWLNGKEVFLYVNYNFHWRNHQDRHVWAKWNIETDSIYMSTAMSEKDACFTHLNNHWISVYKGLIVYTRSSEYNIGFYSSDFKRIDSIKTDELQCNKPVMEKLLTGSFDTKDDISNLIRLDDTALTRIQKIYLLDSNNLLVMCKIPRYTNKRRFDLWSRSGKNWEKKKSEVLETFYSPGAAYNSNNQPVHCIVANSNGVSYSKPFLYFVYSPYYDNVLTKSYERKRDFDEPLNEKVRTNSLSHGIRKYTILFD